MLAKNCKGLRGRIMLSGIFVCGLLAGGQAMAQSGIPNPLRPASTEKAEASPAPAQTQVQANAEKPKPKRERSAKQKQSDDDMRACGARWKADKTALAAKGETWRSYLKTCRAERKAARG
jgi:hypothetical protein